MSIKISKIIPQKVLLKNFDLDRRGVTRKYLLEGGGNISKNCGLHKKWVKKGEKIEGECDPQRNYDHEKKRPCRGRNKEFLHCRPKIRA